MMELSNVDFTPRFMGEPERLPSPAPPSREFLARCGLSNDLVVCCNGRTVAMRDCFYLGRDLTTGIPLFLPRDEVINGGNMAFIGPPRCGKSVMAANLTRQLVGRPNGSTQPNCTDAIPVLIIDFKGEGALAYTACTAAGEDNFFFVNPDEPTSWKIRIFDPFDSFLPPRRSRIMGKSLERFVRWGEGYGPSFYGLNNSRGLRRALRANPAVADPQGLNCAVLDAHPRLAEQHPIAELVGWTEAAADCEVLNPRECDPTITIREIIQRRGVLYLSLSGLFGQYEGLLIAKLVLYMWCLEMSRTTGFWSVVVVDEAQVFGAAGEDFQRILQQLSRARTSMIACFHTSSDFNAGYRSPDVAATAEACLRVKLHFSVDAKLAGELERWSGQTFEFATTLGISEGPFGPTLQSSFRQVPRYRLRMEDLARINQIRMAGVLCVGEGNAIPLMTYYTAPSNEEHERRQSWRPPPPQLPPKAATPLPSQVTPQNAAQAAEITIATDADRNGLAVRLRDLYDQIRNKPGRQTWVHPL